MSKERMQILKMVEAGQISTEEALQLLEALGETASADEEEVAAIPLEGVETEAEAPPAANLPNPRAWWVYPTAVGAVVMAIGAPLVALGLTGRAALFWALFCGWIPFFIGLAILTLGVWSRSARWLHLRVKNTRSGKHSFALSLPLPLTLSAWALKIIRPRVPQLQETAIDEAILALRDGAVEGDDQPFYIDVQDDEGGEQVLIYIG
jgi:hypothetical protein